MLVVGAPSVFGLLWRAVRPFMQEKTAAKIEFVAWADAPQRYEELLGPTVAGRLVAEGLENRNKARAAAKRWTTFYASDLEGDTGRSGET